MKLWLNMIWAWSKSSKLYIFQRIMEYIFEKNVLCFGIQSDLKNKHLLPPQMATVQKCHFGGVFWATFTQVYGGWHLWRWIDRLRCHVPYTLLRGYIGRKKQLSTASDNGSTKIQDVAVCSAKTNPCVSFFVWLS